MGRADAIQTLTCVIEKVITLNNILVRDAEEADVPALTAIKGEGSEAVNRDRLRDAKGPGLRFLVLTVDQEVIAFVCLVFRRPAYWSDGNDTRHLPQIVDLQVKETKRGQGYGSQFVGALERLAVEAECGELYLRVEPLNNPRAYALYRRLGYQQLQSEPYQDIWEFRDSSGQVHRGEDWVVDMVKQLRVSL